MGILDIAIVKGYIRMCNDGWLQGWHEGNGGDPAPPDLPHEGRGSGRVPSLLQCTAR